jgi:maltose alpha-D-glucosyltransferase/alpha-amylase
MSRIPAERILAALDLSGLSTKRWFRQKLAVVAGRRLEAEIMDWAELPCQDESVTLLMAVVRTEQGQGYFLPVIAFPGDWEGATRSPVAAGDISETGRVLGEGDGFAAFDAASSDHYVDSVLRLMEDQANVPSRRGVLRFRSKGSAVGWRVRPSEAYSNTVVLARRGVVLKTYRGFSGGINPEVEVCAALATQPGFENTAPYVGHVTYECPDGTEESVALATAEVEAMGDAWELVQRDLAAIASGSPNPVTVASLKAMDELGVTLARLHLALAAARLPGFGRRKVTDGDLVDWVEAYRRTAEAAQAVLDRMEQPVKSGKPIRSVPLPEALRTSPLVPYLGGGAEMGFAIRCHGDMHLGQVLVRADGSYVVIDFEGEPCTPLNGRRRPTSPLRDVAGMMRSLSYARGAAERRLREAANGAAADPARLARLAAWEADAWESLFQGYLRVLDEAGPDLLPPEPQRRAVLLHFAAEKAMYELVYELNNRPDWVEIPLAGLRALGELLGGDGR